MKTVCCYTSNHYCLFLQVHEVNVALEIKPDPVTIKCNDIVCWIFRGLRSYGVCEVQNIEQLSTEELECQPVTPR